MHNLLITGSRHWTDTTQIARILHPYRHQNLHLVHGAAPGLDTLARNIWLAYGERAIAYPADWEQHGKAAGGIRNQHMVDLGDHILCLAFPLPGSIGTWDCVRRARAAGIPVLVVQP